MYEIAIQAPIGGRVIARESVQGLAGRRPGKVATAETSTRKRSSLEKQKKEKRE